MPRRIRRRRFRRRNFPDSVSGNTVSGNTVSGNTVSGNAGPGETLQRAIMERTLSIIKPDGVRKNHIGDILGRFEAAGLTLRAIRLTRLSKREAEAFYAVHKERPFFDSLTMFMSSGPIVVSVLEGYNAIQKNRDIMGATNPEEAAEGTIRKELAESVEVNTVHGSDAPDTAAQEIRFFFPDRDLIGGERA